MSKLTRTQQFVAGVQLLMTHDPKLDICAEHDVIYVGHDVSPEKIGENASNFLTEHYGFTWDESLESWSFYT